MEQAEILADIEDAFGIVVPQGVDFVTVGGLCEFVQHALEESPRTSRDALTPAQIHDTCLRAAANVLGPRREPVTPDLSIRDAFRWRHQRARLLNELEHECRVTLRPQTPAASPGLVFFFVVAAELILLMVMGTWWRDADIAEFVLLSAAAAGAGIAVLQALNQFGGGVFRDIPSTVRTLGELTLLLRNELVKAGRATPNDTAITWGVRAILGGYTSQPLSEITRDKRLAEDLHLL